MAKYPIASHIGNASFQLKVPHAVSMSATIAVVNQSLFSNSNMNLTTEGNIILKNTDLPNTGGTVHDIQYDFTVRISILYTEIILGTLGGILVILWTLQNKRLKSRVNTLILNLCVADLMVMYLGCLTQLVWEYTNREWLAGDVMCRLMKFFMIFSNCASTNMLVIIAVDRHQAICSPLVQPLSVWVMTGSGWFVAAFCSFPMVFVFQTRYDTVRQVVLCENVFRDRPMAHRKAFITYGSFVNFFIPLVVLFVCYTRIFLRVSHKASHNQGNNACRQQSLKTGKVYLTRSGVSSLPRAKVKTLKMTLVIVLTFILFGLPYFVAEMIMSYGNYKALDKTVYGLLGGLAPANSAANAYIFLLFSAKIKCFRRTRHVSKFTESGQNNVAHSLNNTRSEYTANCRSVKFVATN